MNERNVVQTVSAAAGTVWGLFGDIEPLLPALLVVMALDILSGLLRGGKLRELDSDIAWVGMRRKAMVLILIAAAVVVEGHVPYEGLPLVGAVCAFYIVQELLSILENAHDIGLPVPQELAARLAKFNGRGDGPPGGG